MRFAGRVLILALVPAGLFTSSYVISSVTERQSSAATALLSDTLASTHALASTESPQQVFPAPYPLNRNALPLEIETVVLDPGHGGDHTGTVTSTGMKEKDLTLDIARRLRRLLEDSGLEVVMTREGDATVSLEERVALANAVGGDIFLSIHVNWIELRQIRGVETYYLGPTDDPFLEELAGAENQHPGYSLADLRRLLDGIYADVRQEESSRFAQSIQKTLFRSLHRVNPALQNRGVKRAPFLVLVGTEMPAILAEVSCLSNIHEAGLLERANYRHYIAEALFDGIRSYADTLDRTNHEGS